MGIYTYPDGYVSSLFAKAPAAFKNAATFDASTYMTGPLQTASAATITGKLSAASTFDVSGKVSAASGLESAASGYLGSASGSIVGFGGDAAIASAYVQDVTGTDADVVSALKQIVDALQGKGILGAS